MPDPKTDPRPTAEKPSEISRRNFMAKAGTAAGAMALATGCTTAKKTTMAAAAGRTIGPNEKINVAIVGVGGRGGSLLRQVLGMKNECQVVAVCDTYQRRVDEALKQCAERGAPGAEGYTHHPDVLDRDDVDVVLVATPDHWHAGVSLAAMRAGKDVYCEKPMTHTIAEAREMAETMTELGRIVQVGSQTTSADQWWQAKDAIQKGMIGRLLLSQGSYHRNSTGGEWNYRIHDGAGPDKTGADHVDWEWWLKPSVNNDRPWSDDGPARFFRFRKYWDYSGGIATDLFFHVMAPLNICWPEPQFPWRVSGMGGIYEFDDGREVPDTFTLTADYPGGHGVVLSSSMANSTHIPGLIRGHEGTIVMVPHGQFEGRTPFITVTPETIGEVAQNFKAKWGAEKIELKTGRRPSHMQNFFDCVRSREEPVLSAVKAYRVQVAITLGVHSYRQGKVLYFDNEKGDETDSRPEYTKDFGEPGWMARSGIA